MSLKAVRVLLEVAFSPSVTAVRGILLCLSLLLITGVIRMDKLDIAMFGVSDEFIVPMLIAAIIGSFLAAFTVRRALHNRAADNKVANGKIPDTNSLPYDPRYDCGTLAAFVIGCAGGLFTAPVLVDAVTVNAGMWTSALAAGGLALVLCAVLIYVFHFGLRTAIIQAKDYAVDLIQTVDGAKDEIQGAIDSVKTEKVARKEE